MRVILYITHTVLILLFSCKSKQLNLKNEEKDQNSKNEVKLLRYENEYLLNAYNINISNQAKAVTTINSFDVKDTLRIKPIKLFRKENNKTLYIRYTQLGCSSCSDLFFKTINTKKTKIKKHYNIIVLVDYIDYFSFLKWYKISEIEEKILWVKKGEIPLELDNINNSYAFVVDDQNKISSIFIPNSLLPKYIESYLDTLIY